MSRCLLVFMLMPALSDMINLASAAEIYRWRDAQGKLHYGELVPQDADYEQLDQSTLPPVHTLPVAEKSPQVETTSNRAQQKKSRPKSRRGVQENSRIKRCRRYQEQLETIQSKLRAGYREPQGNRLRAKRRQLEQHQREEC